MSGHRALAKRSPGPQVPVRQRRCGHTQALRDDDTATQPLRGDNDAATQTPRDDDDAGRVPA